MTRPDPNVSDGSAERELDPRAPRDSVMLSALVERFGSGAPTRHRVRDLSSGGVRIDQAAALPVGATVLVTVGALEAVGATVAWVKDGAAGLKFATPIDPAEARAKAAVAPRPKQEPSPAGLRVPTAGWIRDLNNPYGR
jgi:hypothetical protein